jgi:carboxymethylenebutenolidase
MDPWNGRRLAISRRKYLKLFDGYVHGAISRREFLDRAARYAIGGFTAAAMLECLKPNFAWAQQVPKDDSRIRARLREYQSPQGSGRMCGYLARPAKAGRKVPGVLVIHENRGLNPYAEDVARRLAVIDFVAFAPDALTPVGGYPGDEDQARALFAKLDTPRRIEDMMAAFPFLKARPDGGSHTGTPGGRAILWPSA